MDDYTTLEFSIEDNLARITLNRPEAANGFNAVMAKELSDAARRCDLDPNVKTVLLMGNGRFFCGGGDLKEMSRYGEQSSAKLKELADIFHKTITTFAHMDATLVTAVNGIAAGAGFSPALIGDIVIASAGTTFHALSACAAHRN